jgi:ribosomal protein S18 acetylase RimI-like enzyme
MKNHQRRGIGTELVATLTGQFNHLGIYSMLVQVLKQNPYRHFYRKINGVHLRTQHLPFAGEVLYVESYGWIDTSLIYH